MMHISKLNPPFWDYLSANQKDLILQGDCLMRDIIKHTKHTFKDYSFLVFPYAKVYEGYLKQLFLDIEFITHEDYISDHFRLGKYLSSHLVSHLREKSLYRQLHEKGTQELAEEVWQTWKTCRNELFHYYPHNTRLISYEDAEESAARIIRVMERVYEDLKFLMKHTTDA